VERDIDAVITHQFDRAHNATNLYNSIEISGFGKFYFAQNKANKEMTKLLTVKELLEAKLLSPLTEKEERKTQLKLNTVLTNIKALKPKLITNVVD